MSMEDAMANAMAMAELNSHSVFGLVFGLPFAGAPSGVFLFSHVEPRVRISKGGACST
jgi:hypothetical protein